MKTKIQMIAAIGLLAVSSGFAQSYYLAGDYNGWNNNGNQMTGGPAQFNYTITGQTPGAFGQVKVTDGTWNNTWPSGNMTVQYDSTGSATVHFYPGTFTDGWLPVANRVGYDSPDNSLGWGIAGDFDGWDGTQALLPAIGGGVFSNTLVVATAQTFGFKFQSPAGNWNDIYFGSDFANGGANGSYTTTSSPQNLPVVLDLPDGRYFLGTLAPPPVTNQVVFAVDMSVQAIVGNFNAGADKVFASGTFNNWPGTGTGAVVLSNTPAYNGGANTNVYYVTNTIIALPGTTVQFKYTSSDSAYSGSSGYEPISANRQFNLLSSNGVIVLPTVLFGNLLQSDYLTTPVNLTFTVDMANAKSYGDGHPFNPQTDTVYINGNFMPGGWSAWNPIALSQMQNNPVGSTLYTYTASVSPNALINVEYKYGMGYSTVTNYDNEAAAYNDHFRYIRATGSGSYTNAVDTFGNQYAEPSFGQLTSAPAGAGTVAVSWLGRPGVQLQVCTSLGGAWQNVAETDGTNWATGTMSTNGFVSQTNCPATSQQQFFRLQQAW